MIFSGYIRLILFKKAPKFSNQTALYRGINLQNGEEKLMLYESEKTDIENKLMVIKNKSTKPLEVDDAKAFLKEFERLDYTEPKYRSRLLEIFVNKVYLYDDYAIIIYNGTEESNKINLENKYPPVKLVVFHFRV